MVMIVLDEFVATRIKAERKHSGIDRYDEVWDGLYTIPPIRDNEHLDLQCGLSCAIKNAFVTERRPRVQAGANVSDRGDDWKQNYRCPDLVVVLPGGAAVDRDTHWWGGPDFCAEITSPGDRSRDKLDFYSAVGVRELLLIDRDPWSLELFRLAGKRLKLIGRSSPDASIALDSDGVPVSFRLVAGQPRPQIEVVHRDGTQRWLV